MEFAKAREIMVESQVRTSDVTDRRILHAMRTLPRERFVPAAKRQVAYGDLEVEIAPNRVLMRPRDLAKLIQNLAPDRHHRALEIAGATGYGAAVLAHCCDRVIALDPDADLSFAANAAMDSCGLKNVKAVSTKVMDGWADEAPYDIIMLNGAAEIVPETWLNHLAPGGRLGVIVRQGPAGSARIYTKNGDAIAYRTVFDAAPPVTPGLQRPPQFAF